MHIHGALQSSVLDVLATEAQASEAQAGAATNPALTGTAQSPFLAILKASESPAEKAPHPQKKDTEKTAPVTSAIVPQDTPLLPVILDLAFPAETAPEQDAIEMFQAVPAPNGNSKVPADSAEPAKTAQPEAAFVAKLQPESAETTPSETPHPEQETAPRQAVASAPESGPPQTPADPASSQTRTSETPVFQAQPQPQPSQDAPYQQPATLAPREAGAAVREVHSAPEISADPKPVVREVQEISIRLQGPEQKSAEVRLTEQGGDLHVSVRTPDTQLTQSLRSEISDLVGRLERSGFQAQVWQPGATQSAAEAQGSPSHSLAEGEDKSSAWAGNAGRNRNRDRRSRGRQEKFEQLVEVIQ